MEGLLGYCLETWTASWQIGRRFGKSNSYFDGGIVGEARRLRLRKLDGFLANWTADLIGSLLDKSDGLEEKIGCLANWMATSMEGPGGSQKISDWKFGRISCLANWTAALMEGRRG
jgi:hypothetical protein